MRVITEETLKILRDKAPSTSANPMHLQGCKDMLDEIIKEDGFWEEIDQLTVTKLRPMSDAPIDEPIHIIPKGFKRFKIMVMWEGGNKWWCVEDECYYEEDELMGWIPSPTYKPCQP